LESSKTESVATETIYSLEQEEDTDTDTENS